MEEKEPTTAEKIEKIDAAWIRLMMLDYGIKNPRQLALAANVRYESLTLALNEKRNASSEIKNTLYWFFALKVMEKLTK